MPCIKVTRNTYFFAAQLAGADRDATIPVAGIKLELSPCSNLQVWRLDFDDPKDFGYMISSILKEVFKERHTASPLTLRLGISGYTDDDEAVNIVDHVSIWDYALASYPSSQLGKVEIWVRPEPRHHVYGNRGRLGRLPSDQEMATMRASLPQLDAVGTLMH